MKTRIKIVYISIFTLFAFIANAQFKTDNRNSGAPSISKDVLRISNKDLLDAPLLTIKSVDHNEAVISKKVHTLKTDDKRVSEVGNVISRGYPEWTISKPVNRIGK